MPGQSWKVGNPSLAPYCQSWILWEYCTRRSAQKTSGNIFLLKTRLPSCAFPHLCSTGHSSDIFLKNRRTRKSCCYDSLMHCLPGANAKGQISTNYCCVKAEFQKDWKRLPVPFRRGGNKGGNKINRGFFSQSLGCGKQTCNLCALDSCAFISFYQATALKINFFLHHSQFKSTLWGGEPHRSFHVGEPEKKGRKSS